MADPAIREEAQLTLGALAQLSLKLEDALPGGVDAALADFEADRAWMLRLSQQLGEEPARSAVLDTAAWQVILQLDQHGLTPGYLASPQSGAFRLFVEEAFNRAQPAAALAATSFCAR